MNVKTYLKIAAVAIVLSSTANAFQLKKLVGNWKGHQTSTEDGEASWDGNVTFVGKQSTDGGIILEQLPVTVGFYKAGAQKHVFNADGSYRFTNVKGFHIAAGTWVMKNGQLVVSAKIYDTYDGKKKYISKYDGVFKLVTSNKFSYVAKWGRFSTKDVYTANRIL